MVILVVALAGVPAFLRVGRHGQHGGLHLLSHTLERGTLVAMMNHLIIRFASDA